MGRAAGSETRGDAGRVDGETLGETTARCWERRRRDTGRCWERRRRDAGRDDGETLGDAGRDVEVRSETWRDAERHGMRRSETQEMCGDAVRRGRRIGEGNREDDYAKDDER